MWVANGSIKKHRVLVSYNSKQIGGSCEWYQQQLVDKQKCTDDNNNNGNPLNQLSLSLFYPRDVIMLVLVIFKKYVITHDKD